ncbi:MAG: hypothetical protein ACU0CC_04745 [Sagittula sp.]|jgi:hypothetical protein|uniref:hypothetical protein n=1 Tax=unclassified Sagittula TaxID=2624628 RepID=UPI000C2CFE12|nr:MULTISPECIES: hypothetical protein [unclassified Sagittula]AUC55405.1 hypothetical protein CDO87_20550 [Sagittula sp. P11]WHZ37437.1 hypothetical protein QNI11_10535 [Sagittula sp. MA-2]
MTRNVFFRDFTLCKAAALVGLIGAALVLGGVPKAEPDMAGAAEANAVLLVPAVLSAPDLGCDPHETGVNI